MLNREAVSLAVRFAFAVGAVVSNRSVFERKNYLYPDLPKGYQISQFQRPLAVGGEVAIASDGGDRLVSLIRVHIEEDAGKLIHDAKPDASLVDLNRSGTPLIEIVSAPELHSAEEAVSYFTRLRQILMYTGVCDGNMEEGSLRCDANVSLARSGAAALGTRAEIKNLNSFRFLRSAIEFEIERQAGILESGGAVVQETRLFDPATGRTRSMRSKEEAHDYRYFPDPDLLTLEVDDAVVGQQRALIPPLPRDRARIYQRDHGVPVADAEVLVATKEVADYYEATASASRNWKSAANWVRNEVLGWTGDVASFRVTPSILGRLIELVDSGSISGKAAKDVFEEIATNGGDPDEIISVRGLAQISDPETIQRAAAGVIESHPAQVEQYRAGKKGLFGFFVGQLLKSTGGRANPELANQALRRLLDEAP